MSFPTDPLDVRLVFSFNANLSAAPTTWVWTDCTSDLRTDSGQSVEITVGRSDRAKQPEPNQATFSLNNFQGQYTVDNPAGVNFPNVVENVPGIVATGRNANPTFEVDASDWTGVNGTVPRSTVRAFKGVGSGLLTPTGGFATASANIVAKVPVRPSGAVYVDAWVYSVAGWAQTAVAVDWYDGSNVFISTTIGPNNAVPAGVWTYLGAYIGPGPANAATAVGRVVMSGTPAAANTLWLDEARTSIPELCGYVDGWTPQFDDSGNLATCAVSMSGVRRRLGRGTESTKSALRRTILAASPLAYWRLEDSTGATFAGSDVAGGIPMAKVGVGTVNFGAFSDLPGAERAPDLSASGRLSAPVAGTNTAAWTVEFAAKCAGSTVAIPIEVLTVGGTQTSWWLYTQVNDSSGPAAQLYAQTDPTTFPVVATAPVLTNYGGVWHHFRWILRQSGGNIAAELYTDGVLTTGTVTTATLGKISSVVVNSGRAGGTITGSVTHVAFYDSAMTVDHSGAILGYLGELAATRINRLCTERGVSVATINNAAKSMPMGAQLPATFLDLLLENENADGGMLFEPFDGFGFGYVVRSDLYNLPVALTIDRAGGQLAPPFAPVHDDLQRQNDVTVTRTGGSSARYVGDISRGTYVDTPTLNVSIDGVLLNIAAWRVHVASPRGRLRHPSLSVNFANLQAAPLGPIFGATRGVGIRAQVINPPAQIPQGVDLLISGYTKRLAYKAWSVSLLGTAYEVWRVFTIGDPVLGRIDSGGSALTGGPYAAGAVSLSVATTVGPLWITTAGQPTKFPFDADIAGQRVTVTGISGVASPQTFTVNATPASLANGAPVRLWRPACLAL